jgi:hypothetical protein
MSLLLALTGAGGAYTLNAESGTYAISGTAATLLHNRVLNGDAGAYALTGTPATLLHNRVLNADPGAYALAGTDATFVYTPSGTVYTLNGDPGSYSIAGADASFVYTSGYTDTHDGYWTKQWLERHKKPKIEEVIEYVIEQPQEAVAEVRAAVERVYPQIDYREVKNNVKLQRFIANQLMKAIKDYQDDEDMMTFMMMT